METLTARVAPMAFALGALACGGRAPPPEAPVVLVVPVPVTPVGAPSTSPVEEPEEPQELPLPQPQVERRIENMPMLLDPPGSNGVGSSLYPPSSGGAAFDRGAAAIALGAVRIEACSGPNGVKGAGHVTVTFTPAGDVASAVLDSGPFSGTQEGRCIAGRFRQAHVPPFAGPPVRVGKAFSLP